MAQLLSPLIRQGWIKNYLDDVIIMAPDFQTPNPAGHSLPTFGHKWRKTESEQM